MQTRVRLSSVSALVDGPNERPFELLGPHEVEHRGERVLAIRAYLPYARRVWILHSEHETLSPMRKIHPAGLFEAICPLPHAKQRPHYQLRITDERGDTRTMHDPYSFEPLLTDYDLYLFGEGTHLDIYRKFGAQMRTVDDVAGVNFAVWAPNAAAASVIGDFNCWNDRQHAMRKHIPSGVWELFIPNIGPGEKYKFQFTLSNGQTIQKTDPHGFASELPPNTASVVADMDRHKWRDDDWMQQRARSNGLDRPISVYEVHLGSWRRGGQCTEGWFGYRELAHQLVEYCQEMGYTHLELLPINEHPFSGSWGYQPVGYYAVTSRYGSPEEFAYFVDHCHQNGIGVILDWVPAHFPRDDHGLRRFDGTALYEHEDPRQGEHPDWGTLIFNYGRHEVINFLLGNAIFWLEKFHIDGLRVDAVASMLYLDYSREEGEWIPNRHGGRENLEAIDFLKSFNEQIHRRFPGVLTIAEESTAWSGVSRPTYDGGLGFSLKWNMGWMNDTLRYIRRDPIHRAHHHHEITFSLIYAFSENFTLPFSHDEVVHGKGSLLNQMPGDLWQKFANLRLLYSYMWTHPGKKLLFMGNDFGQWNEWNHDTQLQWDLLQFDTHQGLKKLVADLNQIYRREPALHEVDFDGAGFEWIDCENGNDSVLAYARRAKNPEDFVVVCCNFTPTVRYDHRIGVPRGGSYQEIFNSDSQYYGGTNVGNMPTMVTEQVASHGREHSLRVTLPPLAAIIFKPS